MQKACNRRRKNVPASHWSNVFEEHTSLRRKLDADNRWAKPAKIIPWEQIELKIAKQRKPNVKETCKAIGKQVVEDYKQRYGHSREK